MKLKKLAAACALACATLFGAAAPAQAQVSGDVIRIGIITDMSSLYADLDGAGGVEAIRMAIADAGGNVAGKKVEVLFADHQNKADIAAAKAREWFDTQGLDMLIGGTTRARRWPCPSGGEEALHRRRRSVFGTDQRAVLPYTVHWV
jgi:branched-chain amino acid transport system substrate-binding protein